jgi:hypothetical protein
VAIYAGETIRLKTSAVNLDSSAALTSADVTSATINIYNSLGVLVQTATMSYDTVNVLWFYDWQTGGATPQSAGAYRAKFTLAGVAFTAFEFLRFRLKKPPVA